MAQKSQQKSTMASRDIRYQSSDRNPFNIEKAYMRWFEDARYFTRFIIGDGILLAPFMAVDNHIGYNLEYFPLLRHCHYINDHHFDNTLDKIMPQSLDFIIDNGSLCFVDNPIANIKKWLSKVKIGGHIILYLPDEDMYLGKQGLPKHMFADMCNSFTITKKESFQYSYNITDMLNNINDMAQAIQIIKCDHGYRDNDISGKAQEYYVFCESAIEIIIRRVDMPTSRGVSVKKENISSVKSKKANSKSSKKAVKKATKKLS